MNNIEALLNHSLKYEELKAKKDELLKEAAQISYEMKRLKREAEAEQHQENLMIFI